MLFVFCFLFVCGNSLNSHKIDRLALSTNIELSNFGIQSFSIMTTSPIILKTAKLNSFIVVLNSNRDRVKISTNFGSLQETQDNIFFITSETDEIHIEQIDPNFDQIIIGFYPSIDTNLQAAAILPNPYKIFEMRSFIESNIINWTLKNNKHYFVSSFSSIPRNCTLSLGLDGLSDVNLQVIDENGEIQTIEAQRFNSLNLITSFSISFTVTNFQSAFLQYNLEFLDGKYDTTKYLDQGSVLTNFSVSQSFPSSEIEEIKKSSKVVMCLYSQINQCTDIPEGYLVYKDYDAAVSLAYYQKTTQNPETLNLYIQGIGSGNFTFSSLALSRIDIFSDNSSDSLEKMIYLDFYTTVSITFLNISNIAITKVVSSGPSNYMIVVSNMILENVKFQYNLMETIQFDVFVFYSDFISIENIDKMSIRSSFTLNGQMPEGVVFFPKGLSFLEQTYLQIFPPFNAKIYFTEDRIYIRGKSSLSLPYLHIYISDIESLELIGTSPFTPQTHVSVLNSNLSLNGYFSEHLDIEIYGKSFRFSNSAMASKIIKNNENEKRTLFLDYSPNEIGYYQSNSEKDKETIKIQEISHSPLNPVFQSNSEKDKETIKIKEISHSPLNAVFQSNSEKDKETIRIQEISHSPLNPVFQSHSEKDKETIRIQEILEEGEEISYSPLNVVFQSNSNLIMNSTDIMNTNEIGECSSCSINISTDDQILSMTIADIDVKMSWDNSSNEYASINSDFLFNIENNNTNNQFYIYPTNELTNIPKNKIFLNKHSKLVLGKGWTSYNNSGTIILIVKEAPYSIETRDYTVPHSVQLFQIDGTELNLSEHIVIAPDEDDKKDFTVVIVVCIVICIIIIIVIVVALFFTPIGSKLGLITYGPFGNAPKKYDENDDKEAGQKFESKLPESFSFDESDSSSSYEDAEI